MRRIFLTFCDSRYIPALKRIRKQAKNMECFDEIVTLTEKKLENHFRMEFSDELKIGSRGYGYWIWKPHIINEMLDKMRDGDQLLYVDVGCHLNARAKKRLLQYFNLVSKSNLKIGATQIESYHNEKKWTKMDLLIHLGVQNDALILNSGQIESGHIFIEKCEASVRLIKQWLHISKVAHFRDDSPSIVPNFQDFREHRHDQSIFSILCKMNNAVTFSGGEFYPENGASWNDLALYPIHDKRDKKKSLIWRIVEKWALR